MNNIYSQYTLDNSEKKIKIVKDKNVFKMNTKIYQKLKKKELHDECFVSDFPLPSNVPSSYDLMKKYQKEAEELQIKLQEALEELEMLKEEIKDLNNMLDQG